MSTNPTDKTGEVITGKLKDIVSSKEFQLPEAEKSLAAFITTSMLPIDVLLKWRGTEGASLAVTSMLSSMVVGSWTAFEALCDDLWVAAVNAYPNPLAIRAGAPKDGKGPPKSLTIPQMAQYASDFNLNKVMGSVLKAERKVEFISLSTTSSAYRGAFEAPLNLLDDPQLRLLELVRNLIVHDGGMVKPKFQHDLAEAKLGEHPDCQKAEIGKQFPLDGAMVAKFSKCAIDCGTNLIKFVDQYLQSLDEKNKMA
jgi:hypothetical protein